MRIDKNFSISQRLISIMDAARGIAYLIKSQHNAWIHAVATTVVCTLGIAFGLSQWEWCSLVLCFMAVWSAETFNTALELVCDIVAPEFHPVVGNAKDLAAGAVLIAAIGSSAVGAIVLLPHAWALL
jgi:diacylglycerol kinase (ATP)